MFINVYYFMGRKPICTNTDVAQPTTTCVQWYQITRTFFNSFLERTFSEYCTLKPSHLTNALVPLYYILHVSKDKKRGGGSCRTSVSWWMSNENIMGPGSGLRHSIKWGHQNTEQNTSQHSKVIIESKRHANFLTLSLLQFWSVSVFIF